MHASRCACRLDHLCDRWTAHRRLLSEKDGEWLREVRAAVDVQRVMKCQQRVTIHSTPISKLCQQCTRPYLTHCTLFTPCQQTTRSSRVHVFTASSRRRHQHTFTRWLAQGIAVRGEGASFFCGEQWGVAFRWTFCSCVLRVHAPLPCHSHRRWARWPHRAASHRHATFRRRERNTSKREGGERAGA